MVLLKADTDDNFRRSCKILNIRRGELYNGNKLRDPANSSQWINRTNSATYATYNIVGDRAYNAGRNFVLWQPS